MVDRDGSFMAELVRLARFQGSIKTCARGKDLLNTDVGHNAHLA